MSSCLELSVCCRARSRGRRSCGQEVLRNRLGELEDILVQLGQAWVGRAHDITVDVTASGDGVKHRLVDALHGSLEVALDDAVVLDGLTSGDLDGLVTVLFGNVVELNPLLRVTTPPGIRHGS